MNIETLNKKPRIIKNGREDKFDIVEPTLVINRQIQIVDYHTVKSDELCRLDLISEEYYGSPQYVDLILKANGLNNPFSVPEGKLLAIPELENAKTFYRTPSSNYDLESDSNKARVDQNERILNQRAGKPRKPNQLPSGQSPTQQQGNRIQLGNGGRNNS